MTKKTKLLEKIINNPKNVSPKELETLLKQYQFQKETTNAGSHMKWRNKEKQITYMFPKRNPVKTPYIKNFLNILKAYFQTHF